MRRNVVTRIVCVLSLCWHAVPEAMPNDQLNYQLDDSMYAEHFYEQFELDGLGQNDAVRHLDQPNFIHLDSDGKQLVLQDRSGLLLLHNDGESSWALNRTLSFQAGTSQKRTRTFAYSKDDRYLFVGGWGTVPAVFVYDLPSTFTLDDPVGQVDFANLAAIDDMAVAQGEPAGYTLAVASGRDGVLAVVEWSSEQGVSSVHRLVADVPGDLLGVNRLAVSPSGDLLAAITQDSDRVLLFSRASGWSQIESIDTRQYSDRCAAVDGRVGFSMKPADLLFSSTGEILYLSLNREGSVLVLKQDSGGHWTAIQSVTPGQPGSVEKPLLPTSLWLTGKALFVACLDNWQPSFVRMTLASDGTVRQNVSVQAYPVRVGGVQCSEEGDNCLLTDRNRNRLVVYNSQLHTQPQTHPPTVMVTQPSEESTVAVTVATTEITSGSRPTSPSLLTVATVVPVGIGVLCWMLSCQGGCLR